MIAIASWFMEWLIVIGLNVEDVDGVIEVMSEDWRVP
jgi:hypothetical protein